MAGITCPEVEHLTMNAYARLLAVVGCAAVAPWAVADTLEFADGTVLKNCFVRDEGVRLNVWRKLEDVGSPPENIPRSKVKTYKIERDDAWDAQPKLPDLCVAFIEMTPKLAGLHGKVDYDSLGRPTIGTAPALIPLGDNQKYTQPEAAVKNLKLKYQPGETVTLTANVKNVGFAPAQAFAYTWLIDGKEVGKGRFGKGLKEGEMAQFPLKWAWQPGMHTATFKVSTTQKQIATINDEANDPLWAFTYTFIVHKGRVDAWHKTRTAYGTFSFEDYYRWHVDIMNLLFAESKFPATPNGCKARVRLDKIVYADDVEKEQNSRFEKDGIRYDQGGWSWIDDQDRNKKWEPPTKEWRNQTEWSLPHELGHQLGLIDWYGQDYPGDENFLQPDNGEKIGHFMCFPNQMMHWHGPHLWGEVDAANLSLTFDKPRGYFGEYLFALPAECSLRFLDVNGLGLAGAKVELFQRGATIDPSKPGGEERGVKWAAVVEDGNFHDKLTKTPVIEGTTDRDGVIRLPNRPVDGVKTLTGYERKPNPWGNLNVVGQRGLMLARVTKNGRAEHFFVEIYHFNAAWFRGQKDRFTLVFKTPFGSPDSPIAPVSVSATKVEGDKAKVTWLPGAVDREQQYHDWVIGYRVYRRRTSDGLDGRPWMPIATLGVDAREFVADLKELPAENWWNSNADRFAVSAIGFSGRESELVQVLLK